MFKQGVAFRLDCRTFICCAVLFASLTVANKSDGFVRLGQDDLFNSRGSSQANDLASSSCNVLNLNFKCPAVKRPCATCGLANYLSITPGNDGQYVYVSGGSCGLNYVGTCTANLGCKSSGTSVGVCKPPPAVQPQ
jgi:hypothetical protein